MKKLTLLFSFLCFSAVAAYCQSNTLTGVWVVQGDTSIAGVLPDSINIVQSGDTILITGDWVADEVFLKNKKRFVMLSDSLSDTLSNANYCQVEKISVGKKNKLEFEVEKNGVQYKIDAFKLWQCNGRHDGQFTNTFHNGTEEQMKRISKDKHCEAYAAKSL